MTTKKQDGEKLLESEQIKRLEARVRELQGQVEHLTKENEGAAQIMLDAARRNTEIAARLNAAVITR